MRYFGRMFVHRNLSDGVLQFRCIGYGSGISTHMSHSSADSGLPHKRGRRKVNIPREFLPLIDSFAHDRYERIEYWVYALALLMIDEERVRVNGTREIAGREWITLQIYGGDEFDVIKPPLNEAQETELLEGARNILERMRRRQV